jgi:hypothetical protein
MTMLESGADRRGGAEQPGLAEHPEAMAVSCGVTQRLKLAKLTGCTRRFDAD